MRGRASRVMQRAATAQVQTKCGCSSLAGECNECRESRKPERVDEVINTSGEPLDRSTRSFMEPRFGHDFSNVRVHTDARAAESAAALKAQAYTIGNHVVFGNGNYLPGTSSGQQLLAHELTHVVQQSSSPVASANGATVQRQPAPAPAKAPAKGSKKKEEEPPPAKTYPVENCPFTSDFKDENEAGLNMTCISSGAFEKNPKCELTDEHFAVIKKAKEVARKKVEKAESRMHWFGGPEYAERLGRKIFKGEPPDAASIKSTLAKMVKILNGDSMKFRGATCADPLCEAPRQHAAAYESGPTEPVAFCPRSFQPNYLPKMPRTIIHEAVHLAGIDIDPDIDEVYCDGKGCEEQCQDATSADAWALFIDCLGGALIKPKESTPGAADSDKKTAEAVKPEAASKAAE
ncbi:MAG TPA: DUF4157 domain-containing protein [Pyrinomonadaceae bacterium]